MINIPPSRAAIYVIAAGVLSSALVPNAYAEEPAAVGSLTLPRGGAIQSFPIVISGQTDQGEEYSSFVTTDEQGVFEITDIPPGDYVARPAGQEDGAKRFSIERRRWFRRSPATLDLGQFEARSGEALRSD